jgi:hypothetical protein
VDPTRDQTLEIMRMLEAAGESVDSKCAVEI